MATELTRRVGQRIRERREELGLTQRKVAKRMRSEAVDAQRISDWERGINKPSDRYLDELVTALEVDDVSYFYAEPAVAPVPDVLDVLDGRPSQLDRIERKLDELLSRLPGVDDLDQIERELERDDPPSDEREADTG